MLRLEHGPGEAADGLRLRCNGPDTHEIETASHVAGPEPPATRA
jgi:hypothetical protein